MPSLAEAQPEPWEVNATVSRLRIGTCSWKYPSWAGLVYSAPHGINYLHEYARMYDTVEVDQWFWSLFEGGSPRLPLPSDVAEYRRSVPDTFRFTVKAPNALTLTHYRQKTKSDPLAPNPHFLSPDWLARFLALLDPLGDTLGPIALQFGYLNRQHLSGQAELLERIAGFLEDVPNEPQYALEIRNPKWLNAKHFGLIADRSLVPVLLQGYWMPPVWEVYRESRDLLHQAPAVVIRLHGPDREGMERETGRQWDHLVVERNEELRAVAGMTQELLDAGVDVYLNVNNHYEGSAPLTVERLSALMGQGTGDRADR
jgi:uncharacterized protein YecE (DUF72 family)